MEEWAQMKQVYKFRWHFTRRWDTHLWYNLSLSLPDFKSLFHCILRKSTHICQKGGIWCFPLGSVNKTERFQLEFVTVTYTHTQTHTKSLTHLICIISDYVIWYNHNWKEWKCHQQLQQQDCQCLSNTFWNALVMSL